MDALFGILSSLTLLLVGYAFGKRADRKHLAELAEQVSGLDYMLVTQLNTFPHYIKGNPPQLLMAETVVATDYFKTFLASWRSFFGGEIKSYQSLMVRARLEVLVQLQSQAAQQGFNALCGIKFESADIAGATTKRKATAVALIATATAYNASV